MFSKQSDNILISTKLHHGLTSDHTAVLCKLDVSVPVQTPETFSYKPTTLPRFSLAQHVNSSFKSSTPSSAKTILHLFLQRLSLTIFSPLWTMTTSLFFFCWIFLQLLTLFTIKSNSPLRPELCFFFFFFFFFLHSVYCTQVVSVIPLRQISVHFSQ